MNVCRLIEAQHVSQPGVLRVSLVPMAAPPLPAHLDGDYRVIGDRPLTIEEAMPYAPRLLSELPLDPEHGPFFGSLEHAEIIVRAQSGVFRGL